MALFALLKRQAEKYCVSKVGISSIKPSLILGSVAPVTWELFFLMCRCVHRFWNHRFICIPQSKSNQEEDGNRQIQLMLLSDCCNWVAPVAAPGSRNRWINHCTVAFALELLAHLLSLQTIAHQITLGKLASLLPAKIPASKMVVVYTSICYFTQANGTIQKRSI